ncbi:MAG: hypothetical protein M1833_005831 [Piccolia ochrophora]|nr:MAG: hypothetical protein M1833_005831 [Piccolia ochrophora]
MDYSYFSAAPPPQPYQFVGLPPTPTHTQHANSDEGYSNGSPQDFPDQNFQTFDAFGSRFDGNGLSKDPQSPKSLHRTSIGAANGDSRGSIDGDDRPARSSSEEKESLTPAQSRRKAQNRAAQRAFRERKERHVKELEQKLTTLEQNSTTLVADNERLKRELQKVATENEILRATSTSTRTQAGDAAANSVVGPMNYSPTDFYTSVLDAHDNKIPSHRIVVSEATGERLLAAGATWDFIQEHDLFKKGLVDVGDVCERLKKIAKCDGQGPVFEERDIIEAIEASAASGSDELI